MRRTPEESKLEALNGMDAPADRAAQSARIKPFLGDKHFRVVAKAASLTGERSLLELIPDLTGAYARSLGDPVKRDPNCIGNGLSRRMLLRSRRPSPRRGDRSRTAPVLPCTSRRKLSTSDESRHHVRG